MSQYVIYCRKSTESEEKQVLSIESQINELNEFSKKLNLSIGETLIESKSAKSPGRPIFNEMMKKLYKRQYSGVVCWKLDRLARNPIDGAALVGLWIKARYPIFKRRMEALRTTATINS